MTPRHLTEASQGRADRICAGQPLVEPPGGIEPPTSSSGEDPRPRWQTAWYLPRSTRTSPPPWSSQRPRGRVVLPIFIRQGWPQAMSHFHVSPAHRHAIRRFGRSQRTVGGAVMGCRRGPDGPSRSVRATASQLARGSRIVRRPALRLERPGIAAPPTPPPCRRSRWSVSRMRHRAAEGVKKQADLSATMPVLAVGPRLPVRAGRPAAAARARRRGSTV
jgi:hypothetical protein